ncbi:serine/threonine kinase [Aureococcus anophagefferens]|nr:serine/threonine kinase [Aureococcus anophagefferens]
MMMARWWWLAPVALAAASASEVCDADVVAAASCPRGAELLRRAKARRLPLAVTMLWATCPERPPADDDDELARYKVADPARYAKLKRRRDREPDLGRKRPDPAGPQRRRCDAHARSPWRLGCFFDAVLQIDLDATVLEDPRPFAASHAAITATGAVVAEEENAKRDFVRMRTHLALLKPDEHIFDALLAKARTGDYVAMTNTDQDVLEAYFCPGPRQWVGEPNPPNRPPDDKQPATASATLTGRRCWASQRPPGAGPLYRENALVSDLKHMHLRGGYRPPRRPERVRWALAGPPPTAAARPRPCRSGPAAPQGRDGSPPPRLASPTTRGASGGGPVSRRR